MQQPCIDGLIQQFQLYFDNTWLTPEKLPLWNHFHNDEPWTNNAVEGWHSSLKHKLSRMHLHLAKFLTELQVLCHDVDGRLLELQRGEPAKPRHLQYIANDAPIEQAKLQFANFLMVYTTVPVSAPLPDANSWLDF